MGPLSPAPLLADQKIDQFVTSPLAAFIHRRILDHVTRWHTVQAADGFID